MSGVVKRAYFADDLANLQEPAGVELSMSSLHGFDMFGSSEAKRNTVNSSSSLPKRLDRQKSRKAADNTVHALRTCFLNSRMNAIGDSLHG